MRVTPSSITARQTGSTALSCFRLAHPLLAHGGAAGAPCLVHWVAPPAAAARRCTAAALALTSWKVEESGYTPKRPAPPPSPLLAVCAGAGERGAGLVAGHALSQLPGRCDCSASKQYMHLRRRVELPEEGSLQGRPALQALLHRLKRRPEVRVSVGLCPKLLQQQRLAGGLC